MKLYKTEGIVIKRKNIGEADRILTVMTRDHGKLKVIAKGIRRIRSRRSGHVEVFCQSRFTLYQGRTFDSVTEVSRLSIYDFPHDNLQKVSYAYYLCELTDLLIPERQEMFQAYNLLEGSFYALCKTQTDAESDAVVSKFAIELLRELGFLPHNNVIPRGNIYSFIESIVERKLKTPKFIEKVV